jgi:hypothetical protein
VAPLRSIDLKVDFGLLIPIIFPFWMVMEFKMGLALFKVIIFELIMLYEESMVKFRYLSGDKYL